MAILTSPAIYEQHPENAWERFRNRIRKPRDLAVLMEVAAWRESEAQTRDVPRSRVLKDDIMIELVLAAPKTIEALANLRAFPRGMERSRAGADILAAIERGLARDPKTLPKLDRERRNGCNGATVELLRVLLRHVSESHGVAAKMIASVEDLEAIAADDHAKVAGPDRLAARPFWRPGARTEARPPRPHRRTGQGRAARMAGRAARDRRAVDGQCLAGGDFVSQEPVANPFEIRLP